MRILIKDIKAIVQVEDDQPRAIVRGEDMKYLPTLENAWMTIVDDAIEDFGSMDTCPDMADIIVSADSKMLFPSFCDSHTHIVYAGSREREFVDRINGLSYEEIARRGGGILNSAKKLNETTEDELVTQAMARINEVKMLGTGAVEIKSGYGLTVEGELKMLRVIKRLKRMTPLRIKSTFLGAHAIPAEYKENRQGYLDLITKQMLPKIAEERLADYIDVFCDQGFFTPGETDHILQAGAKVGLKPKVHANELGLTGGVQAGVRNKAISVDHLEHVEADEIHELLNGQTMPTLLPSTAFFLRLPYAPARKMIDSGLPVALASDYNPGSSPSGNMPFVVSLACIHMGMLPAEAINAATINGAAAMELSEEYGSIARGKKANFFLTKPISSLAFLPYSFGSNLIDTVFINGQMQTD